MITTIRPTTLADRLGGGGRGKGGRERAIANNVCYNSPEIDLALLFKKRYTTSVNSKYCTRMVCSFATAYPTIFRGNDFNPLFYIYFKLSSSQRSRKINKKYVP